MSDDGSTDETIDATSAASGAVDPKDAQQGHWTRTFEKRTDFLGGDASAIGQGALERFRAADARDLLELGAGQGRDTLLFVTAGLKVTAVDYAAPGLGQIAAKAAASVPDARLTTVEADVRRPLPFDDESFDAVYAHMLLCMALSTPELESLAAEIRRVLRPDGLLVYTVRNTTDAHYGAGVDHGDDMFEMGGFIVHFFDIGLVERLARRYRLVDVSEAEEGKLPRRLFVVTQARS